MKLIDLMEKLQEVGEANQDFDMEVRVQDEDGIYSSEVVTVEDANGPWVICKTQSKESD